MGTHTRGSCSTTTRSTHSRKLSRRFASRWVASRLSFRCVAWCRCLWGGGRGPSMSCGQADVDAAFRRVPVAAGERWCCGIAFLVGETVGPTASETLNYPKSVVLHFWQVYVSKHMACPFGAVASVHAWERVGAALTWLAQKFLKLGLLRYVDDMFAPERCVMTLHMACCGGCAGSGAGRRP